MEDGVQAGPAIFLGVTDTRIRLSTIEGWARMMREKHGDLVVRIAHGDPHDPAFVGQLPNYVVIAEDTDDETCAWIVCNTNPQPLPDEL